MSEGGVTNRITMASLGNNDSSGSDITERKSLPYSTIPDGQIQLHRAQELLLKI